CQERLNKHDHWLKKLDDKLTTLLLSYKDTEITVKKDLVTYTMMRSALESANQEFDKRMKGHLQDNRDYIQQELSECVPREVSYCYSI
ncbi:MAG: hypothetical protein AAGH46_13375, partial [Bacteroidota bacterium]